jgi:DNA-binding NarL/FixJ family response regulator
MDAGRDESISVLVADDQALVRAGFRAILEGQPDLAVVGEAVDGFDAVDPALRRRPDADNASDLVLSAATVKTHVKHVLAKLDVRDRVQAVVFAYDAGVVAPGDGA